MRSEELQGRVGRWMQDDCDVYAGRGRNGKRFGSADIRERGWLGNPYSVEEYGREGSIEKFRRVFERRLESDEEFREAVKSLAGKTLGCWCQPIDEDGPACHAEVIAEWADRLENREVPQEKPLTGGFCMSWSGEITLWCDGDRCSEWIRYQTTKVTSARASAESDAAWDCNRARDLCRGCKEDEQ